MAAHGDTKAIMREFLLVGLVRVATIAEAQRGLARRLITAENGRLNETEGLTCKTWARDTCERLRGEGLMVFESWEGVEAGCVALGEGWKEECERNEQPRPVGELGGCGFGG